MTKAQRKKRLCSICGVDMGNFWDHNAAPVNSGRCCGDCNATVVIPARIARLYGIDGNFDEEKILTKGKELLKKLNLPPK